MIPTLDTQAYLEKMLSLHRLGGEDVLAFYEHRIGAVCKDHKLMLIPLDDHIVHRGDGIFETVKFVDGKLYQLESHLQRMQHGADTIFLTPPCSWEDMGKIIIAVAKASEEKNGLIRILFGRGPGGFGIDPAQCPVASLYVVAYRFTPQSEAAYAKGFSAFRCSIPAKQGWAAQIKSVNYLPNVLMKREALEKGYDYPVCFDSEGFMAEGATENYCLVCEDGTIAVPEFKNSLPGTTLMRGLELLSGEVQVSFRKISEHEIYTAREMLVFGTTRDCTPIVEYEGKPLGTGKPGPVSVLARKRLTEDIQKQGLDIAAWGEL